MAVPIEFWKQGNKLFVEYNKRVYNFNEFIRLSEAQFVIDKIYQKITREYPAEVISDNNKCLVVGTFIKNHFLKRDNVIDVIILDDGKIIRFNLEE